MATSIAHILRLPPELLLRVANRLNTFELGHFRRTCKYVETSLFEPFAREFFTKRQFMIEDVSLQALVGIANHRNLSRYLTGMFASSPVLHFGTSREYSNLCATAMR
jgi:hypothetical protein